MISGIKKDVILVFLLFAFIFAFLYRDGEWNGNSRLGLTFALVEEQRLTIDSFHNQPGTITGDKALYSGHFYTDKAIGSSLVAVFFYFPLYLLQQLLKFHIRLDDLKNLLTFLSIGLPSALSGCLLYILCRQASASRFRAYAAASVIMLGTKILPFSVTFFGHQLAGALLIGAFFLIYQLKESPVFRRKIIYFLIGLLPVLALITEYTVAPIVLILALYYLFVVLKSDLHNRTQAILLPLLGACIPLVILMAYNTKVYGAPLAVGYTYEEDATFRQAHAQGLMGVSWPNPKVMGYLTIHPAMGLFWQSPVLLVSLIGLWFMARARKYRIEAFVALAACLALFLINSGYYMWWGGETFGPRFLIPMLPFLCLPLVFIPGRWFYGVILTGSISIIHMFIAVLSDFLIPDKFFFQIAQKSFFAYSNIYSYCLQLLLKGDLSTNIVEKLFGIPPWFSLIPLLLVVGVINLGFFWGKGGVRSEK